MKERINVEELGEERKKVTEVPIAGFYGPLASESTDSNAEDAMGGAIACGLCRA